MAYAVIKHNMYKTGHVHDHRKSFLIDGEEDVVDLPVDAVPGCIAYTADCSMAWQMSPSKIWTKVIDVDALFKRFNG